MQQKTKLIIPDVNISLVLENELQVSSTSPQAFASQFPLEQKLVQISSDEYIDDFPNKPPTQNLSPHIQRPHSTSENRDTMEHV